ncbi:MAG: M20 family metallopeptidase [Candidatus Heimdallarchaeota archaeon]
MLNTLELKEAVVKEAKALEGYVISARRQIHQFPETAFEEVQTSNFIEQELRKIGYDDIRKVANTGLMATLPGKAHGKTVALRADIDALNVQEENNVPYKSQNPGKHHACGHDAHTAMLLGAAKIFFQHKDHLPGPLKLFFQPAEEDGGGGKLIVEEGHLDDVDVAFAIHVWVHLPAGTIATRKGAMLASADDFSITVRGKGGGAAVPQYAIDPTAVLVDIYNALQKIVSREISPFANAALTAPMLDGSNAFNIIPNEAKLQGTFRTMDPAVRTHIRKRIKEIVQGYSQAWRCKGSVDFDATVSYPPLVNDGEAVDNLKKIIQPLDTVKTVEPSMGSEDFTFYLEKAKGAMIALGIYNEEKGIIYPNHHPKFDVDEEILWKGSAAYALLGFYSLLESSS